MRRTTDGGQAAEQRLDRLREVIQSVGIETGPEPKVSSSGKPLDWLIDLRPALLRRDVLLDVAAAFWHRFSHEKPFQIGGMETAAIPLLVAIVMAAPPAHAALNAFIIRKERKATGMGRLIEGTVSDLPIVLVDDIVNSGKSAERARLVLDQAGRRIATLFTVVDFGSARGMAWRKEHRIATASLFTLRDFDLALKPPAPELEQRYRKLWHTAVPGGYPFHVVPKSAPVLVEDRLFRGSDAGRMQAFDASSGAVLWEHRAQGAAPRKGIWSTPAIHDGRLYYGAYNGVAYALDTATGRELWSQSCCEWIGSSPLVVPRHDLLVIGLEYERPWARGSLTALDLATGAKRWEKLTKNLQHGSAAYWAAGDLLVWGTADHQMVGLDAATGNVRWVFETRRSVKLAPRIDEERAQVAFASFDKSIYLLDVTTGAKRGEWQTDEICYTTPLFVGNKLFCGSGDRHLYVIDVDRRTILAKINLGARVYATPVLAGDRVLVGTCGGKVMEIGVATLEIEAMVSLPDAVTNPVQVTADGRRIFVSTAMNDLYCFERLAARGPI